MCCWQLLNEIAGLCDGTYDPHLTTEEAIQQIQHRVEVALECPHCAETMKRGGDYLLCRECGFRKG